MAPPRAMKGKRISPAPDASFEAPFAAQPKAKLNLNDMPAEVVLLIGQHSTPGSAMSLGRTCKGFYPLLHPIAYEKDAQDPKRPGRATLWACMNGNIKVLRLSLDAGCRMDLPTQLHKDLKPHGATMTTVCVRHKDDRVPILKELLTRGLNIKCSEHEEAPWLLRGLLHKGRNPAMIAFLLALGYQGSVNHSMERVHGPWSGTPLSSAVRRGLCNEALIVLLDAGGDPMQDTERDSLWSNDNAMAVALHRGHHRAAQLFLDRGVTLNPQDQVIPFLFGGNGVYSKSNEQETLEGKLARYVPLGLDINQECPINRICRLHVAFEEDYTLEYVQTLLKWGADPKHAYRQPYRPLEPPHNAYQALLLIATVGVDDLSREEQQVCIRLGIDKARAMLAAENADVPTPEGDMSLLAWAIKNVPLEDLEAAVRILEPWLKKMQSGATVATDLQDRLKVISPRRLPVLRRIVSRVEARLREHRVPGFMKDWGAVLRDRSKLKRPRL